MVPHSKETARNSIRTCRKIRFVLFFLILSTWLAFSTSSFASESGETKRVLILYSFRYGLVASELLDSDVIVGRSIRETFKKDMGQRVALYNERMGVSELPEDRYFEKLRDEYQRRYADRRIDLILVVNFRALNFLIRHGEEIWPNTPIVFCGVHIGRQEQMKQLRPNITGLIQDFNKRPILETIFKIHPDTRQVAVIMGTSETDQFIGGLYRKLLRDYEDRVEIIYMDNLGFETVLERVANLPSNSFVLYSTLITDGDGKPAPMNALPLVSRASSAPVYGDLEAYVGYGIVGGRFNSLEGQGAAAAELGLRILAGERPEDIPPQQRFLNVSLFDWRQLKRWGIAESDLPQGSIIRYREVSFYELYYRYIWGVIVLIVFETLLISFLMINRTQRRRAEEELKRAHHELEEIVTERTKQLKFEKLISRISSEFINLPASRVDKEIEHCLQLVAENFDIGRIALLQFSGDKSQLNLTHTYAIDSQQHAPVFLVSEKLPWFSESLRRGKTLQISKIDEMPEEAMAEKQYAKEQGFKSFLTIPMIVADSTIGAISYSSMEGERDWSDGEVQRFKLASEILANALGRQQKEQNLQKAFSEVDQLKDRLQQENIYLKEEINLEHKHSDIVGKSPAINYVLRQVEQVAITKSSVLIQGETGTGKELLSRAIHNLSSRKDRAMVVVNCSALPPGLIESELFGREKGAYTGALAKQLGRFEIANGSTIFLDEIAELPLELQAKLLRVLQEGEFQRLGSTETIKVDVRVVAASNRNLSKAVSDGSFREDLYYRLNVFPIILPPLRERKDDIPLLVWKFVEQLGKIMGKRITSIRQSRMEEMISYAWPGNVRELRNVVEHAIILSKGTTLNLQSFETMKQEKNQELSLDTVVRNHITAILEKTGWRVKGNNGAAELLGLHPATLFSRMKKLGIKQTTNSDDISSEG